MDKGQIELAYNYFRNSYRFDDRDAVVDSILKVPKVPWIRLAREALLLKSKTVAIKLGVSPGWLLRVERDEKKGRLTIETLQKIAAAIDCELVYAFRPKQGVPFSKILWQQIYPDFLDHHWLTKCEQTRRAGALAALAREAMLSPKYRRAKGWYWKP